MANGRTLARVAGGCLAAGLIAFASGDHDVLAAKRRGRGKSLTVRNINVEGATGVAANQIIEVKFSAAVSAASVNPAVFQIREENATGTGFPIQIFGDFQVSGSTVRFFPRLPSHLRDPADPTRGFYTEGSALDNASENAGLKPGRQYEMRLRGRPFASPIKSTRGRALRRDAVTRFRVATASDPATLYTTRSYADSPPPQVSFTNPIDRVPAVSDQFSHLGGAVGVPTQSVISVFGTKVPIAPATLRVAGNVTFTLVSRRGDPTLRRPIEGSVFLEQNFNSTLLVFKSKVPLADVATYALSISKSVKDLTEQYDFQANRARDRLRRQYDSLSSARSKNPGMPVEMLPITDPDLFSDWRLDQTSAAEQGVLKSNLLTLGDNNPDEINPRVMVLMQTQDEPVTEAFLKIDFLKAENIFDARLSTGEVDNAVEGVPSAATAILTVAGGSAVDGDFLPEANTTLVVEDFAGGVMNFRDVIIPQGVTVKIVGSKPAEIRAINFTLDGTITLNGENGETGDGSRSTNLSAINYADGGAGGPGGGEGAGAGTGMAAHVVTNGNAPTGKTGLTGTDSSGQQNSTAGGFGGLGGEMATGTYYSYGGGGGGGGAKDPGLDGTSGNGYTASWNGKGGIGGAGSNNETLNPMVGGAGGGSGGNGVTSQGYFSSWGGKSGSGGGGGAGAINIQTARRLVIGQTGVIGAVGGVGGGGVTAGSYGPAGPGGGGGGGTVRLRSGQGFSLTSPATAINVSGGAGGTGTHSYGTHAGGDGGRGYVRLEDPFGGQLISGGSVGLFDPIGGGVASRVFTKFIDLGVDDPRLLEFEKSEIATDAAQNDAILVEMQMTREDPRAFGVADLTAIDDVTQGTLNPAITSPWLPIKMHDLTGVPGGAIKTPGYDPLAQGLDTTFPIGHLLNGKGYRFVRYKITFQLDQGHRRSDPIPSVGAITLRFQFNF